MLIRITNTAVQALAKNIAASRRDALLADRLINRIRGTRLRWIKNWCGLPVKTVMGDKVILVPLRQTKPADDRRDFMDALLGGDQFTVTIKTE